MSQGVKGTTSEHGTIGRYSNHRCRCEECRQTWRNYCRELNHRRGRNRPMSEYLADVVKHGIGRYKAGCRCDECRAAAAAAKRKQRANNAEKYRVYFREHKRRQRASRATERETQSPQTETD